MSTQHGFEDDTNDLPRLPKIRSTAKKMTSWQPLRPEAAPNTSMVAKEFGDFDQSISDEEPSSPEQARGDPRSNRNTPSKVGSSFQAYNNLYDMTPPTNRSRKSYTHEGGSLRRDAQIRRASRTDLETASPRPASTRKSSAVPANQERKRASLADFHAKLSGDDSSFMEQRPPTITVQSTKNTRWSRPNSRQTSLQLDGMVESALRPDATPRARPSTATAQSATGHSFVLPDLPNLTELVSGVFQDGTPVFSKNAPARTRFGLPRRNGRGASHIPVDSVPIPDEEKAIFAALHLLQEKVAQMENERAEAEKKMEEQELEIIELRIASQAQEKLRRSDNAPGATDGEGAGKASWKVEKTRKCQNLTYQS